MTCKQGQRIQQLWRVERDGRTVIGEVLASVKVQSHGLQNGAVLSVFDQHPTDREGVFVGSVLPFILCSFRSAEVLNFQVLMFQSDVSDAFHNPIYLKAQWWLFPGRFGRT